MMMMMMIIIIIINHNNNNNNMWYCIIYEPSISDHNKDNIYCFSSGMP